MGAMFFIFLKMLRIIAKYIRESSPAQFQLHCLIKTASKNYQKYGSIAQRRWR